MLFNKNLRLIITQAVAAIAPSPLGRGRSEGAGAITKVQALILSNHLRPLTLTLSPREREFPKHKFLTLCLAIILCLSITEANAKDNEDRRLISVTGEAKMDVVPDIVEISLTVEVSDKILNVAQKKNDEITAQVLKLIKALGIEDKNVQTNYINVQPVYEYPNNCGKQPCKQLLTRFETRKGIHIKLTDISKLQDLLEKSIDSGVTRVNGIEFTSSKLEQIKSDVQITAAKNARKKAEDIAGALGVKVSKPYRISVGYSSPIAPRPNMMMAKVAIAESADSTIAPGEVTITATVNADFEID
jgi:uncharacterized protein YggE